VVLGWLVVVAITREIYGPSDSKRKRRKRSNEADQHLLEAIGQERFNLVNEDRQVVFEIDPFLKSRYCGKKFDFRSITF